MHEKWRFEFTDWRGKRLTRTGYTSKRETEKLAASLSGRQRKSVTVTVSRRNPAGNMSNVILQKLWMNIRREVIPKAVEVADLGVPGIPVM